MKIVILTDCEGVAGVVNWADYGSPGAMYYETTKRLTTLETNAAVEGAIEAGATEILVVDGHGHGALNLELLHPAVTVLAGPGLKFPFGVDESFDAAMIVGQHAMSNADGGHLCHTGGFEVEEAHLNGRMIGEIGALVFCWSHLGVPLVMLSGDEAACAEARDLVPGVETATVKWGMKRGSAAGLDEPANVTFNSVAIHVAPVRARELIREAAKCGLQKRDQVSLWKLDPPYESLWQIRKTVNAGRRLWTYRGDDPVELFNSAPEIIDQDEAKE